MHDKIKMISWYRKDVPPPPKEGEEEVQPPEYVYKREAFNLQGERIHTATLTPDGRRTHEINRLFNEQGVLLLHEIKDYQKNIQERTAFQYDESGKLREELIFLEDKLYQKIIYFYDENGLETERRRESAKGKVLQREVYERDAGGRPVNHFHLNDTDKLEWARQLAYDENGLLMQEAYSYFDEEGGQEIYQYAYDKAGNRIHTALMNEKGFVLQTIERKYDEKGAVSRQVKRSEGVAPVETTTQWVRNEAGNVVHEEEYDSLRHALLRMERTVWDDEEELIKYKEIFGNKDGSLQAYRLIPQYEYYLEETDLAKEEQVLTEG